MTTSIKFPKSDTLKLQATDYNAPLLFEYSLDKINKEKIINRKLKSVIIYNIISDTIESVYNNCKIKYIYDATNVVLITLEFEEE